MIIITGGTRGIGLATARLLSQRGSAVLITGRDADAGREAAALLPGCLFVQANAADPQDCAGVVAAAMEAGGGRIDGLVNNAGIAQRRPFADSTLQDWDEIFSVNARGVFEMTRLALPGLRAARGSVVNIASVAGYVGEEGLSVYTAAKAAVIGLTRTLALELGREVRFNAVCPGQIATRMMRRVLEDPALRQDLESRIPNGRMATPEEVGEVIVWLLSDQSRYVNGAVLPVDGGETAGIRAPAPPV